MKAKNDEVEAETTEKPSKTPEDDENDSEEDDEDYNPEEDAAAKEEDGDETMEEVVMEETNVLAPAQKRAVDEAFKEIFGYDWGTSFQLPRRREQQRSHQQQMLVQIFGPVRAARILKTGRSLRPKRRSVARQQAAQAVVSKTETSQAATSIETAPNITPNTFTQKKEEPQYETKIFAGKAIQVPRTAGASNKKAPPAAVASKGGGIDSVLQQLSGPSKISTVAKTSSDWDTFKTETGLEGELEKKAQGKDAYLVKQDFLTRVDTRKFELEKTEREKERAKRGK